MTGERGLDWICMQERSRMQIETIQELVKKEKIAWSKHFSKRLREREFTEEDVVCCIMHGEIIEDYPYAYPYPACLIYGLTIREKVFHVVVGTNEDCVYMITGYFPNLEKFETDLKTRRV